MNPLSELARYGAADKAQFPFRLAFGRGFGRKRHVKALVIYEPNRISFSQVYPFLHFQHVFAERYDAEFRFIPTRSALQGIPHGHRDATHVLLQTWLTDPPDRLPAVLRQLRTLTGAPRLVYLDSFANTDVRLIRHLEGFSLYYKKALFMEPGRFLNPTYGHTNLTEYYGRLYGVAQETTDWQVPESTLSWLRLAPNFLTDPTLLRRFLGKAPKTSSSGRDIDLHARLGGTSVNSWYGAMRRDAEARALALKGIVVRSGTGVSRSDFLSELRRSKLCFSPFGYGELCWRDIEAMAMGAVLVKPDMSHLRTEPDLYRDEETYLAVRWDFADLEERVFGLLADDARREAIARTAWERARSYLENNGPADTFKDVFSD